MILATLRMSETKNPSTRDRTQETGISVMSLLTRAMFSLMLASAGPCADGQSTPRSQLGVLSQSVGSARVEVAYRRPVARGRELFGALVPWGRIWTPSADSAARFTTSTSITINGSTLTAGTYGIWAIPDSASWTVIFSSVAPAFHLRYPDGHDVLRVR